MGWTPSIVTSAREYGGRFGNLTRMMEGAIARPPSGCELPKPGLSWLRTGTPGRAFVERTLLWSPVRSQADRQVC